MSKVIAVFGATGSQGGSVLKALAKSGEFAVKAITRDVNSEKAKKLESLTNVTTCSANLDDVPSLERALKGCYGVFLVTDFTAHFDHKEVAQGVNLIDSAIKNGLSHIVFSGLENVASHIGKPCWHFDYKAEIENYGLSKAQQVNFTSIRMPMYFESLSMFTNKIGDNQYAFNLPMNDAPLFGMSVDDIGECVLSLFKAPEENKSKIVGVASDKLTRTEYLASLNKNLAPAKFVDGKMSLETHLSFGYPGVEDIVAMIEYYHLDKMDRDIALTRKLNPALLDFNDWLVKNKDTFLSKVH